MLNNNSRKILGAILTILIITIAITIINYFAGRFIIKYDPNLGHKQDFSSDRFFPLLFLLFFYSGFVGLVYFLMFKIFLKNKKNLLLQGFITSIFSIILIEIIITRLNAIEGVTIGKVILYSSIFLMGIFLPYIYQFIKTQIRRL